MRAYLEAHAILTSEDDYSAATAHIGSIFLAYLQKHPEDQALDLDGEYDWTKFDPATGGFTSPDAIIRPSITDVMKEKEQAMADALHGHGFSGFMVGHGLNAAKYALGQSPVHNPAIVDLNV